MKYRIAISIILVIVIAELGWLAFALDRDYSAAVVHSKYEANQLMQREAEINALENTLAGMEDAACADLNARIARIREEIAMLENQTGDISREIDDLSTQLEELKTQLEALQEENTYYQEVYNELKKGLEKVKGYIADG